MSISRRVGTTARKTGGRSRERAKTDDSLRAERLNTDEALLDGRASVAREADGVVDQARALADAVLSSARRQADQESLRPRQHAEVDAVAGERARADLVVRSERGDADVVLRNDRKDQADALAALLVHERAATDAYLITERARSDDAVEHRDDFLGMVAHDVRNLLNAVAFNLELLRPAAGAATPGAADMDAVNRIQRYVARMNRLIGDLVDVTSIDAGKLTIALIESNAAALVAEAMETFQPAAVEKGVSLSTDVPARVLLAQFDHDRMLQVLANVIANAIKFTPRAGSITVSVESTAGAIRFCISDTGVGIPAPKLNAIFERFWQVGENDLRGQGLGLYISRCIVEAHHGRIWAESAEGKGSQLYFTLPESTPSRSPKTPDRPRPR
jgi:signal transduction histidine kinase